MTNLEVESHYIDGARAMLLQLLNFYKLVPKEKTNKDDAIYTKAEIDHILKSKDNTRNFLYYGLGGGYYEHIRDKKGNLVSCKFMLTPTQRDEQKLKELQKYKESSF